MTSTLAWSPFDPSNSIGDPGRQTEIRSVSGPQEVGVPDTALDFLTSKTFELRACSSRGWSHRYAGTPRQDSYSVMATEDLLVVAVADGVSEGQHSQVAAETAARSACKLVVHEMGRNGSVDWLQLSRRISLRIIDEAEYRQISVLGGNSPTIDERLAACLKTMATTLIVAIFHRTPRPDGFPVDVAVVAGDSAAYVRPVSAEQLIPAGGGKFDSSPILSSRVRPLPGAVEPTATRLFLRPGDMLAVGSDGIGDPVGDGTSEVGRELAHRWKQPPTIDQYLLDINFFRRSYDDDRTCVSVWVHPEAELPATEVITDVPEPALIIGTPGPTEQPAADVRHDGPADPAEEVLPESTPRVSDPSDTASATVASPRPWPVMPTEGD